MVRVVVLEDNAVMSARLVDILLAWEQTTDVAAVSCNAECVALLQARPVDILLVDLDLPDGSGHESIRMFADTNPDGLSIVISALSDGESIIEALKLGAIGYLHKDDTSMQILEAIRLAQMGNSPISPSIAFMLVNNIREQKVISHDKATPADKRHSGTTEILTAREIEVLNLIAKGLSYGEASQVLGISKNTLPVHIRNIYRKLHANNRSEAVFEARAIGVLE